MYKYPVKPLSKKIKMFESRLIVKYLIYHNHFFARKRSYFYFTQIYKSLFPVKEKTTERFRHHMCACIIDLIIKNKNKIYLSRLEGGPYLEETAFMLATIYLGMMTADKTYKPNKQLALWRFFSKKIFENKSRRGLILHNYNFFLDILNEVKRASIKKENKTITVIDLLLTLLKKKSKKIKKLLDLLNISPNLNSIVRRLKIIDDIKNKPKKKRFYSIKKDKHENAEAIKELKSQKRIRLVSEIKDRNAFMAERNFPLDITSDVFEILLKAIFFIQEKFKHKKLDSSHILLAILIYKNPIIKKIFYPYTLNIKNYLKDYINLQEINKNVDQKKNKKIKIYNAHKFTKYLSYFVNILKISKLNKKLNYNVIENFSNFLNKKNDTNLKPSNNVISNLIDTNNYFNNSNNLVKLDSYFQKIELQNINSNNNNLLSPLKDNFNISWLTYHSLENFDFYDYGYESYYTQIFKILLKSENKNVLLIGEDGVGKTTFLKKLAKSFLDKSALIPNNFKNKLSIFINTEFLISKVKSPEKLNEAFNNLIKMAVNNPNIFLFIDDIEFYCKKDENGTININFLEQLLLSNIKCIACTTTVGFNEYFSASTLFNSKFEKVLFNEPTISQTKEILKFIKPNLEKQYEVEIKKNIIDDTCFYSKEYGIDTKFPKKAITLLKNTCLNKSLIKGTSNFLSAKLREQLSIFLIKKNNLNIIENYLEMALIEDKIKVYQNLLKLVLFLQIRQNFLQIPKKKLIKSNDLIKSIIKFNPSNSGQIFATMNIDLLKLENELQKRVIGQDNAIKKIISAIKRYKIGLKAGNKPIGSFFLAGPTGVGKTEFAKALAKFFYNNENAMLRLDMSEYTQKENVSALIGSPPGYVGYEEGGKLTEFIRINPYSLVLFDEMEKAHVNMYDILLQVLDDGRLTDSRGNTVDFTKTFILFTSNIGVRELENIYTGENGVPKIIIKPKLNKNLFDYVKKTKDVAKNILPIKITKNIESKLMKIQETKFNKLIKKLISYGNLSFSEFTCKNINSTAQTYFYQREIKNKVKLTYKKAKFEDIIQQPFNYLQSTEKSKKNTRTHTNLNIKNYYTLLFMSGKSIILKSKFSKLIDFENNKIWELKSKNKRCLNLIFENANDWVKKLKLNVFKNNLIFREILPDTKNKNINNLLENNKQGADLVKHYNNILKIVKDCLFDRFRPEFINRIDDILVFERLNKTELKVIAIKLITDFMNNFFNEYGTKLFIDEQFVTVLIEDGYEPKYGARPLKRALNEILVDNLVEFLMDNEIKDYSQIFLSLANKNDYVYTGTKKIDYQVLPRLQQCQASYISKAFSISENSAVKYLNKKYIQFNNLPY